MKARQEDPRIDPQTIFSAAVSKTRMPIIVTDPNRSDHPIVYANSAFVQMSGYSLDELVGRNCRLLQGRDTDPQTIAELSHAIRHQRDTAVEILNYRKGGEPFWNALTMSPVFDDDGRLTYYFGSQLDITQRRDAVEGVRQAQKLEAVGQLAGGIAHDFNNLLQVIQGFGDILLRRLEGNDPVDASKAAEAVRAIMQAADRGATLTQRLLAFSRKQTLQSQAVDLADIIDQVQPVVDQTVGSNIQIRRRQRPGPCSVRIDVGQAELAIINVVINARDAMPMGGTLTLELETRRIVNDDRRVGELPTGDYVVLSIRDDGAGMTPQVLARATEPFFTTKEQGKGTGLGLAMVYGFMKQSGGALRLESQAGAGTTVRMLFPQIAADPVRPKKARPPLSMVRGHETVLLVEDQTDVAAYAQTVLEEFGYKVIRADNGEAALSFLGKTRQVDLLFSDLIMPGGMNGVVLAREAQALRPSLRVLLTTGFAESSIDRVDALGEDFEVIQKPYSRDDLMNTVRRILGAHNGET